jgi:acyl carrier protein
MDVAQTRATIMQVIHRVVTERGHEIPELTGATVLLGGAIPIDSLDLAAIVVELESRFGKDPSRKGSSSSGRLTNLLRCTSASISRESQRPAFVQ